MTYEQLEKEWLNASDSMQCHTSGSTGAPKPVLLKKKFMLESAARTAKFFSLSSDSLLHSCISADFIGGKMMFVRSRFLGCRFSWEEPSNRPLDGFSNTDHLTMVSVVPSQLLHILDNFRQMPKVDIYLVGGSPLPQKMIERIVESNLNVYESYGMTETSSHIAVRKVTAENLPFTSLPGIEISLSDDCLKIMMPDGTQLITNDIAKIDNSGTFRIIGRKDNIIISGGKKINPEEVERVLQSCTSHQLMISSRPDEKWGERLVCLIEVKQSSDSDKSSDNNDINPVPTEPDEEKLISKLMLHAKQRLRDYQRPKEYIVVNNLPRTASGKLKRK